MRCVKRNKLQIFFSLKSADVTGTTGVADTLSKKVPFLCIHFSEHAEGASSSTMIDNREYLLNATAEMYQIICAK